MSIELRMPALSPTMEEGTIARWLVKKGDTVVAGDLIAEIETDKATMEFEAVDEGVISDILVEAGAEGIKVGTVIAVMEGEGGDVPTPKSSDAKPVAASLQTDSISSSPAPAPAPAPSNPVRNSSEPRVKASPLAKRIASQQGVDLSAVAGSGPHGRIVKADIAVSDRSPATPRPASLQPVGVAAAPFETVKLSGMRKTIARRLTESKQTVPHFYLTVDCNLDPLLRARADLNAALEGRGIKLSVNDLLIKALGVALAQVPDANVQYAGDNLLRFSRVDISMAVAIPGGLITPVITDVAGRSISSIAQASQDLAARARAGQLQPEEYQGGTASISNLGMYGIKQFDAVINPPQSMILAVGAGEKRPCVIADALGIATVMSATGSFDHRAIDGAVGAELMAAFKRLVENPLGMLA